MDRKHTVMISKFAEKQMEKLPRYIKESVLVWAASVEEEGIRSIRKLPGYHDEPLLGKRKGLRSVRLSRSFRLIYQKYTSRLEVTIRVIEVNKHDY